MTTFVIDAELQASDASFVVGTGSYTVTGLPTSSPLSNQWFAFPAGVVVAGGKEVWEYDQVVPIDDYAALGPREAPGETYATPWPEDEMVSADMHFNLGLHVKQHSEILEDHERRIRDNEAQIALLTDLVNQLLGEIGPPDGGGGTERECFYMDYERSGTIGFHPFDYGWHPSAATRKAAFCKNSQGKVYGFAGRQTFWEAPLNTPVSIWISNDGTDEQRGNLSKPLHGTLQIEDAAHSGAHPDYLNGPRLAWMSKEFNGDPLPSNAPGQLNNGILEHNFAAVFNWYEDGSGVAAAGRAGWIVGTERRQFHLNFLARGFNYCNDTYGGVMQAGFAFDDGSKWDGKLEDYSC